uniref:Putative secreted protein n=1 Tax=Anopheles darlingi TaxID=43151 RepID=A0A2M4DQX8_ANODA
MVLDCCCCFCCCALRNASLQPVSRATQGLHFSEGGGESKPLVRTLTSSPFTRIYTNTHSLHIRCTRES